MQCVGEGCEEGGWEAWPGKPSPCSQERSRNRLPQKGHDENLWEKNVIAVGECDSVCQTGAGRGNPCTSGESFSLGDIVPAEGNIGEVGDPGWRAELVEAH